MPVRLYMNMYPRNTQHHRGYQMLLYPLQINQGSNLAGDLEQLEDPARPITPSYPLQGSNFTCDLEQLEDPARPMITD